MVIWPGQAEDNHPSQVVSLHLHAKRRWDLARSHAKLGSYTDECLIDPGLLILLATWAEKNECVRPIQRDMQR